MKKYLLLLIFLFLNSTFIIQNSFSQWVPQSVPVTNDIFFDMKFVNANTGFIAHSTNVLLKTTDAGFNWSVNKNGRMFSISIVNGQYIYGSGNVNSNGILYKSSNLGITWDSLLSSPGLGFGYLYFFNQDTGLIGSGDTFDNYIYRTTDGGQTKQLIATFGGSQGGKFHFLKEKVNGEYYGWMYYGGGINYRTTNSGLIWTEMPLIPTSYSINCLFYLNKDTGWVTVGQGQHNIFITTNGGTNWLSKNLPGVFGGHEIYFANSRKGWISSVYNFIYATNDGGLNWGTQVLPIPGSGKIFFLDSIIAWNGDGNYLSHTTNGGGNIVKINNIENSISSYFTLSQNYPNPFNPSTSIKYYLRKKSFVELKIFDITGKEVLNVISKEQNAGDYEKLIDFSNKTSGIYFYRLTIKDNRSNTVYTETRRMIFLK